MDAQVRLFLVSPALALRRALARALDAEPQIVVIGEARTSAQAVARVPAVRPDVVLASAHLTDPDSPEMCRRLLDGTSDLQVLLVGVNAPLQLIEAGVRAGAAGVVPHTIDEPELVEAIETVASGQTVLSTDTLATILRAGSKQVPAIPWPTCPALSGSCSTWWVRASPTPRSRNACISSPGTVRNYVSRLFRKLDVERRAQVIALAARSPGPQPGPAVTIRRPGPAYSGISSSGLASSSTLTSLNVTTLTFLTKRAGRYMSHTQASLIVTSK